MLSFYWRGKKVSEKVIKVTFDNCTSKLSLEITVDAMRDIAISALKPAEEGEGS